MLEFKTELRPGFMREMIDSMMIYFIKSMSL